MGFHQFMDYGKINLVLDLKKKYDQKGRLKNFAVLCIAKSRKLLVKFCFSSSVWCIIFALIPARKQGDWHKLKTIFIH